MQQDEGGKPYLAFVESHLAPNSTGKCPTKWLHWPQRCLGCCSLSGACSLHGQPCTRSAAARPQMTLWAPCRSWTCSRNSFGIHVLAERLEAAGCLCQAHCCPHLQPQGRSYPGCNRRPLNRQQPCGADNWHQASRNSTAVPGA